MFNNPQCQCYKSLHKLEERCPHRAKEPDFIYCGIHQKSCRPKLIMWSKEKTIGAYPSKIEIKVDPPKKQESHEVVKKTIEAHPSKIEIKADFHPKNSNHMK